jgi:tRNA(Ile2) C34 agmatinyltransferase TiaS
MSNQSNVCPVCGSELTSAGENAGSRQCGEEQAHICPIKKKDALDDEIYENFLVKEALVSAGKDEESI